MTTVVDPMPARHLYIHLDGCEPGLEVHIHITNTGATGVGGTYAGSPAAEEKAVAGPTPAPADASAAAPAEGGVQQALTRLRDYGNAANVQAMFDGLVELGYVPHCAGTRKLGKKPESYLRWVDPAVGGAATLYLDTASARFARADHRTALVGLPGAAPNATEVLFAIKTAAGVEQALAAAKTVKAT